MSPPPGRLIDVGGFRLHLHATGHRRPTVVLDAALGGSSISWTYVQPRIAEFARVCSYDRAGFAWSDRGPLPRTAGRIADELRVLLERGAEPPPYVLVGHSFGGLVTRIFAARHPELVSGLVLLDPALPEDWVKPAPKEQARIDRGVALCRQGRIAARLGVATVVSALVGLGAIGPARRIVNMVTSGGLQNDTDWLLAPLWKLPPAARRPLRSFWTQPKFFEALGSQIESMSVSAAETIAADAAGYGNLPLATISCTNPDEHRSRRQDALAARSLRGRHLVASSSSHWIPLDQPELVAEVVRSVIDQAN